MGKTMSEKIIARAAGKNEVSAGEIVWVDVDRAMLDDILGPRVQIAEGMKAIRDKVFDPEKVVVISDHYTPPASIRQAEIVKFTRDWAKEHQIKNYYEFEGPCHQVMAERGHILPGTVVLGTDSHTCTGGAFGAFASGVGSTEMMGILITGMTWLRVPETVRVCWEGGMPEGVTAKDVSLATIGALGHAGATYKTIEYVGGTISGMCMDERMTVANMAVEMGAKAGLMEPDGETSAYLREHGAAGEGRPFKSDPDALFCETLNFDAAGLTPLVACPHQVDNVRPAGECNAQPIDQAYLGSCTGGRYSDLKAALHILKGRKIKNGVRLLVSPASQEIWKQASKDGILDGLAQAGAVILASTCGVCVGLHSGLLAAGEICISASNRNFLGRMGSREAKIYLGSPMTVAASAVTGRITDPRELM